MDKCGHSSGDLTYCATSGICKIQATGMCDRLVGHSVYAGKDAEHGVDNVGTVPAALSTFLACQRFQPDLIVSVGTAGGFKSQGAAIGDVFVGTSTVNHDRRIPIPVSCQLLL